MSSRARLAAAVILGVAILALSTTLFAAVAVWRAGSIVVSIDPQDAAEPRIHLRIPAILVPAALALVPDATLREVEPHLRGAIPIALRACDLLENQGDALFVEVVRSGERVRIAKIAGALRVDVSSADENVHVELPISSLRSVFARLDRAMTGAAPA